MTIELGSVRTDYAGFQRLAGLNAQIAADPAKLVTVECAQMRWFDSNMTAALDAVFNFHRSRGRLVRLARPKVPRVATVLRQNGFLRDRVLPATDTMMPHTQFHPTDKIGFANYTAEHLRGKGMPRMTVGLLRHFLLGLDELFGNVDLHADTDQNVTVAGQAYPERSRLLFTLADCGIGIRQCVYKRLGLAQRGGEAIDWAMTGTNTTRGGDVPGGLGLKIVREFINLNNGTLTVVSESGYWRESSDGVDFKDLPRPFPGTVIALEIRTDDKVSYSLSGERQEPVKF